MVPESLPKRGSVPVRITVKCACADCACPGIGAVGMAAIGSEKPNSHITGLWAIGGILISLFVIFLVWLPIVDMITSWFTPPADRLEGVLIFGCGPIIVWLIALLAQKFPMRAVICARCRRVRKFGFGKTLPLTWQECIEPQWECTQCGYSLHGLSTEPRCPECDCPFPEEWLKFTSKGDPGAVIEYDVVP